MAPIPRVGDLEVAQDLAFERRNWRAERVGWALLALLIVAALAGLLGPGPLSSTTVARADGKLTLEYERFARMHAPTQLRFRFGPQAAGEVRLWVERRFLDKMRIERVVPQPERVELAGERLTYVFPVARGEGGEVSFQLQPEDFGRLRGRAGIGEATLDFAQLVYP